MPNYIFIIVPLVVAYICFSIFFYIYRFYRKRKFTPQEIAFYQKKCLELKSMITVDPRNTIMEADKILDHLLSKKGYKGPLGEKLKKSNKLFSDLNGVWDAHKERNRIAHELDYQIGIVRAKDILKKFERAYFDLGIRN